MLTSEGYAAIRDKLHRNFDDIENMRSINAFISVCEDRALKRALSDSASNEDLPLSGWIIAVKDNIHVSNTVCSAGTSALKRSFTAKSSSVVERLEAAGAIINGKTNMHELAYGITSINPCFGPVKNPHNHSMIAGGSSGGSAAAVAAGLADAALGTDTGGSVRLPASLTGLVGYRPTTGRYPTDGVFLISSTRDTIGLITRSVQDAIDLDARISSDYMNRELVGSLRIGVPRKFFFEDLDPQVADLCEEALRKLEDKGVVLVEADLDEAPELASEIGFPICLYETVNLIPEYLRKYAPEIDIGNFIGGIESEDVASLLDSAFSKPVGEDIYRESVKEKRSLLKKYYKEYFEKNSLSAIIFPTSPLTARPISNIGEGVKINQATRDTFLSYIRNTNPASVAGLPAVSIPAGKTIEGLPVGMEIDGPEGSDWNLLAIAKIIESIIS